MTRHVIVAIKLETGIRHFATEERYRNIGTSLQSLNLHFRPTTHAARTLIRKLAPEEVLICNVITCHVDRSPSGGTVGMKARARLCGPVEALSAVWKMFDGDERLQSFWVEDGFPFTSFLAPCHCACGWD
jgi:hypothetical protein